MAVAEDAASVLEIWVQDSANLPAEMQHLMEEIEAKDKIIAECRHAINQRDMSLQRHVKANGGGTQHAKEDQYNKTVLSNFDKAQALQEEKIILSEKSRSLLDRQIKRLDQQIRSLETSGILAPDPLLPSILNNSHGNRLPSLSISTTGASTPLNPIPGNAGLPPNSIANAAIQRLIPNQSGTPRNSSPTTASPTTGATTPTSASANSSSLSRSQREGSLDAKRRRTNAPAQSSSLRQSSLGPSATPKAGTPAGSVRGGSVGPRTSGPAKKFSKSSSNLAPPSSKGSKKSMTSRRKGRKGIAGIKASLSDTGEDSALSEDPGSETEGRKGTPNAGGLGDIIMGGVEEEGEEDGDADGDDKKYCTCKAVSYGNMVACDNDDCPYEWFHWNCVGMTKEPVGKWYCAECTQKLGLAK